MLYLKSTYIYIYIYIYILHHAGAAGMLLHINVKFTMEIWNQILCRKISLVTTPHFQFRGVGQDVKQTYLYLWYPLFQAQCYRCYQLEHVDDISFREITHNFRIKVWKSNVEIFHWKRGLNISKVTRVKGAIVKNVVVVVYWF